MLRESLTRGVALALVMAALSADRAAYGVNPNSLQSAYWRFEEAWVTDAPPVAPVPPDSGQGAYPGSFQPAEADTSVVAFPAGTYEYEKINETHPSYPGNVPGWPGYLHTDRQVTIKNTVKDSINENHLTVYAIETAPTYVNYSLPPTPLASGEPNTMAWEVNGDSFAGHDAFTDGRSIQNGVIGGSYDTNGGSTGGEIVPSSTTGFTLEAAFSVYDYGSFRSIVAKEGRPGLATGSGDPDLPTLALKVRGAQFEGDPDQGKLQIELFDGAGNLKTIMTDDAMVLGSWYYAAVVNDGQTLSLYVDRNNGEGYELVGSEPVAGALFQGTDFNNADWNYNWAVGRASFGGPSNNLAGLPADFFNGLIDEVRLTNEALDPSQFLFAQEAPNGDFNGDEIVDGTDFLLWQRGESPGGLTAGDLQLWKDTFSAAAVAGAPVPEPGALVMAALAVGGAFVFVRRR